MDLFEKLAAATIVGCIGYVVGETIGITDDERKKNAQLYGWSMVLATFGIASTVEEEDTYIYHLYHKGK